MGILGMLTTGAFPVVSTGAAAWSMGNFLNGAKNSSQAWQGTIEQIGKWACWIMGVWFLWKAVSDKQGRGKHVLEALGAFMVGVILTNDVSGIGNGMENTAKTMGQGNADN